MLRQCCATVQLSKVVRLQVYNKSSCTASIYFSEALRRRKATTRQDCTNKQHQAHLHAVAFAIYNSTLE